MRISDWSSDVCSSDLLDRGLPRPQAQRIIGQRGVIGVERERRAGRQTACRILLRVPETRHPFDQFGPKHSSTTPVVLLADVTMGAFARISVKSVTGSQSTRNVFALPMIVTRFAPSPNGDRKSTRLKSSHYCASRMPP